MSVKLPAIIQNYIDASNAHDVDSILACFDENAEVRDENETRRGKDVIADWIGTTIAKYKFQFSPLSVKENGQDICVVVKVSGTFPGSPVTLDYHFATADNKISSLTIDS